MVLVGAGPVWLNAARRRAAVWAEGVLNGVLAGGGLKRPYALTAADSDDVATAVAAR